MGLPSTVRHDLSMSGIAQYLGRSNGSNKLAILHASIDRILHMFLSPDRLPEYRSAMFEGREVGTLQLTSLHSSYDLSVDILSLVPYIPQTMTIAYSPSVLFCLPTGSILAYFLGGIATIVSREVLMMCPSHNAEATLDTVWGCRQVPNQQKNLKQTKVNQMVVNNGDESHGRIRKKSPKKQKKS